MIEVKQLNDKAHPRRCKGIIDGFQCPNKIHHNDYYLLTQQWKTEGRETKILCADCGMKILRPIFEKTSIMFMELTKSLR